MHWKSTGWADLCRPMQPVDQAGSMQSNGGYHRHPLDASAILLCESQNRRRAETSPKLDFELKMVLIEDGPAPLRESAHCLRFGLRNSQAPAIGKTMMESRLPEYDARGNDGRGRWTIIALCADILLSVH